MDEDMRIDYSFFKKKQKNKQTWATKDLNNTNIYLRDKDFFFRIGKSCTYSYVEDQECIKKGDNKIPKEKKTPHKNP